ncbi:MAG: D-glycero-beta-D-manno-heptose 1,7-bisphosphate 7-phosphatase [Halioglobus sp.]
MLIFLDRDGVINEDSDDYIRSLEDWIPLPGSIEAIAKLSLAGFTVAIVTNQSGLGRGYFELEDLEGIHDRLCQLVEAQHGSIAGIFYCPHLPDADCSCRKPGIGLLKAATHELQMDPAGAYMVGDSLKDLQAAQRFNCRPILVKTGKGMGTLERINSDSPGVTEPQNIPVYADLAAATEAILSNFK